MKISKFVCREIVTPVQAIPNSMAKGFSAQEVQVKSMLRRKAATAPNVRFGWITDYPICTIVSNRTDEK
jgi:hypothetical protein